MSSLFFNFRIGAIERQLSIFKNKMEKHRSNPEKRINYILCVLDAYGADTKDLPDNVRKSVNHEISILVKKEGYEFVRKNGQIYIGSGDRWFKTHHTEQNHTQWPKCLDNISDRCLYGKKEEW